jgi:hypothetical protein
VKQTFEQRVANAERYRNAYAADPRVRQLAAERLRRYRERQAVAAHEAALAAWVAAVEHAEGATP